MHLADVALRDEPAERSRVGTGHGGVCKGIRAVEDLFLEAEGAFFDRLDRRTDRIDELDVELAAIDRRNELFADRAGAHHRQRQQEGRPAEHRDQAAVTEAPRQRSIRVPASQIVEPCAEPLDHAPRFPVRTQRPQTGQRRRDRKGDEERRKRRDPDDDAELGDLPPDLALDERDRQEYPGVDQRNDDRGRANLFTTLGRRLFRRLLELGKVPLDILQNDRRVVDQDADHQRSMPKSGIVMDR